MRPGTRSGYGSGQSIRSRRRAARRGRRSCRRLSGSTSADRLRPTAQPRLRPAAGGAAPLDRRHAVDDDCLPAAGARAVALTSEGWARRIRTTDAVRVVRAARRSRGRPVEPQAPDDRRGRRSRRGDRGAGQSCALRPCVGLGSPARRIRRRNRLDGVQRSAGRALRAVVPAAQLADAAGAQEARRATVQLGGPPRRRRALRARSRAAVSRSTRSRTLLDALAARDALAVPATARS